MAVPDLADVFLGRVGGTTVTSLAITSVDASTYDAVAVHVSVRVGGSVSLSVSGLGATWTAEASRDDTQNVLQQFLFVGTGHSSTGTITVTATAGTMETGAASAWGLDATDVADVIDAVASADAGATDTSAPSTTVTPGSADTLLVGFGTSRTGDLSTAGTNYTIRMNGWSNGAAGGILLSWVIERTANHPASGAATAVDGTLGSAREWIIIGAAIKAAAGGAIQVAREVAVTYDIIGQVSREWAVAYDLGATAAREVAVAYDIVGQAANEWAISYDIGIVAGNRLLLLKVA